MLWLGGWGDADLTPGSTSGGFHISTGFLILPPGVNIIMSLDFRAAIWAVECHLRVMLPRGSRLTIYWK